MNEQGEISKTRVVIMLSIIILLGAVLRLYKVNYQSLWFDEIYTIQPTDPQNSIQYIIDYCKEDQPPAFFLYVHYFFKIFGYNDLNGRIASAIIGIVSLPVIYLLGKELRGKTAGLLAALLTSINYFHIKYSQEVRFYGMAFLFSALSYWFFIRAFKSPTLTNLAAYVLTTTILLYTHYFGLIIFAVQAFTFIVLIIFYRRDKKFIIAGLISGLLVPILLIPWIPQIWSDLGITTNWINKPQLIFIKEYFYTYFGRDRFVMGICVIAFIYFFRLLIIKETSRTEKAVFIIVIIWLVLSYAIPYFRSIVSTPILEDRYTMVSLPAWMIIFAVGVDTLKKIKWKYYLATAIFISSMVNLLFIRKYYTKIIKQQIREMAQIVQEKNTAHDMMISNFEWHCNYYFRNFPRKVNNLFGDFSTVDKFWVLIIELTPQQKKEHLKLIDKNFEVAERHTFYKTEAMLMVKKK